MLDDIGTLPQVGFFKIADAPVKKRQRSGAFLLWPGLSNQWVVGTWTGYDWMDDLGQTIAPVLGALLPPVDTVLGLLV